MTEQSKNPPDISVRCIPADVFNSNNNKCGPGSFSVRMHVNPVPQKKVMRTVGLHNMYLKMMIMIWIM